MHKIPCGVLPIALFSILLSSCSFCPSRPKLNVIRRGQTAEKTAVCGIILFLLMANMLSVFIIQSADAQGEPQQPSILIVSPQNSTYTANASIPLTFIVDGYAGWVGCSLNGQPNTTITGNTTLPTLPDGFHRLTIYANDTSDSIISSARHFTVDTTAPTGSIQINNGAVSTIDASVILTLSASDATSGVAQMRFFDFTWNDWEPYTASKPWTFTVGEGYKTIYVQFMDNAGLISSPYRATIFLGNTNPSDSYTASALQTSQTLDKPPQDTENNKPEKPPEETPKPTSPESPLPTTLPTHKDDQYFHTAVAGFILAIAIAGSLLTLLLLKKRS